MIVPSIDVMGGQAVQLVQGEHKVIDAGDPRAWADRFGLVGEIAVIDLDAAKCEGSNEEVIRDLLPRARCRVGGGIRDVETALKWLDAGAAKVILGTAARREIVEQLPRERVIAALDARDGEVVVEGWRKPTGVGVEERIIELRDSVGGILVTFVEREGGMGGLPIDRARELAELAAPAKLTVAGGVRTADEVAAADRASADTQVGMALYTGAFDLADGFCAPLVSDRPDGLWPSVVADERGTALGLVYSSIESVRAALETGRGVYQSRSRGGLWTKGESSGDTQDLLGIDVDCDRDALRFTVRQHGAGFCHVGSATCFGHKRGLDRLADTIKGRLGNADSGSYTSRVLGDPAMLRAKLLEEAAELAEAATPNDAAWEAADLFYFALASAMSTGAGLEQIERELDRRSLLVTRRDGSVSTGRVSQ